MKDSITEKTRELEVMRLELDKSMSDTLRVQVFRSTASEVEWLTYGMIGGWSVRYSIGHIRKACEELDNGVQAVAKSVSELSTSPSILANQDTSQISSDQ